MCSLSGWFNICNMRIPIVITSEHRISCNFFFLYRSIVTIRLKLRAEAFLPLEVHRGRGRKFVKKLILCPTCKFSLFFYRQILRIRIRQMPESGFNESMDRKNW
jgi:hypothetical protein